MSNIIQEIIFPGTGLDTDTDPRFMQNGDAPWRLNVFISGDGANGVLTNMLGNSRTVDISDHELILSNVYFTVGSYYNRLTRKCYYLVFSQPYDSDGSGLYLYDNRVFCYNEDTNTLDLIFTDIKNYLGLDPNELLRDLTMLGDWLYINPRSSEPKMIDVVRAFNYTNYEAYDPLSAYIYGDKRTYFGGLFMANTAVSAGETPISTEAKWDRIGDSYQDETGLDFDSEFYYAFNVIKMPSIDRPILNYSSDTNVKSNNVRGKIFRFSYRYKYFDDSYSVYSGYSDISLPVDDEKFNGEILANVTKNNVITITLFPHSAALIKEIEIVFQQTGGDWRRARVINRIEQVNLDQTSVAFNFYNNESYIPVPNVFVAKIEDSVPKRAESQEIINLNILSYGGCTEGFDNLDKNDIQVSLTPILTDITVEMAAIPLVGTIRRDNVYSMDVSQYSQYFTLHIGSWFSSVLAGDKYALTINGVEKVYTILAGDVATITAFINAISGFIGTYFTSFNVTHSHPLALITVGQFAGGPFIVPVASKSLFYLAAVAGTATTKKKGFKTGANHPFCLFYYDANMRRWDAQVSKENVRGTGWETMGTTAYVPLFNQETVLPTTASRYMIDWEVNHLPPAGAKYWRWGYAGNSLCSYMVQYIISSIAYSAMPDGLNLCKIDITPLQTLKSTETLGWNQFANSIIDPYEWEAGDRIRFITGLSTPGNGTDLGSLIDMSATIYDVEIVKQSGDQGEYIFTQRFTFTDPTPDIGENSLVEIYRPLKSITDTKLIYYEFGDMMPIIEDSVGVMVHGGQYGAHNQDTGTSASASGTFDGGDIYHIVRTPSKPLSTDLLVNGDFHESMWYSDFYDSDDYDRGKIGIETTFGERTLNVVRYSNQYIQNTQINGLSTFDGDRLKELNDVYGNIVAIYEQGDTLKVYQERKASSILIGRTEYYDSQGSNAVALSDRVFGSIRYSPSNYSTVFPESIARNNKFIYGFDIYNGVMWRDSVNGLFPISGRYAEAGGDADYKMQTYFKLKSKALLESGIDHVDVISVWDEEYKLLYVTFKDFVLESNNETIVFHEPSNRWMSFMSLEQTPAGGYNVLLEPTFEVVKGFAAGIGFNFNEETRFFEFDINTPPNFNSSLDVSQVVITAYDFASAVVNETATLDVAAVTITPYDPSDVVVTNPPSITFYAVEDIPDGEAGQPLIAIIYYSNGGDATSEHVVWSINETGGGEIATGSELKDFVDSMPYGYITLTTLVYPSPSGSYTLILDGGALTKQFYSI